MNDQVLGLMDTPLPRSSRLLQATQWQSVGWANGAVVGASLAAAQTRSNRRTILFAGDGGLQLVRTRDLSDIMAE